MRWRRERRQLGVRMMAQWYEHLNNDQIIEHMQEVHQDEPPQADDDSEAEDGGCVECCPVTHQNAMEMFDQCLTWLRHQPEASTYNLGVL